ncbi:hypothetical protein E2C01_058894 [Portunus trituberculatus]|uniref:Uncharacterized protein n=1 Tax=Portunus trituberculatus TaxID=210409 RepID=A0A5B7H122_PORTR|nr:hypothetical protein [Portunus trituberculatus]
MASSGRCKRLARVLVLRGLVPLSPGLPLLFSWRAGGAVGGSRRTQTAQNGSAGHDCRAALIPASLATGRASASLSLKCQKFADNEPDGISDTFKGRSG